MDLPSLLRSGRGRLTIGVAAAVLAAVVAIGVVAGHAGSGQTAGATGTSGPTGSKEVREKVHRQNPHAAQKPEEVEVPNVVGESGEAAAAELAAHDLRGHFVEPGASYALACAEAAPSARAIGQVPRPGRHAPAGERVALFPSAYVEKGCGRPSAARACDPAELSLSVGESKPDYTGGGEDSLAVARIARVRGQSECAANSTLTVSIDHSDGQPLSRIAGNPITLRIHASLNAGDKLISEWLLGAWCGSRKGAVLTASFAGLAASQPLKELPYGDACPIISLYSLVKANAGQG